MSLFPTAALANNNNANNIGMGTVHTTPINQSTRPSDKTQEARRVLLSDINFTSMVPELSRSADHLCQHPEQDEPDENSENRSPNYCKGNLLKTPDPVKG